MAHDPTLLPRFSRSIERSTFIAYFLGAVVPLFALAWLAHLWVLPELSDDTVAKGLVGGIFSTAVLSLASFLALRRSARRALLRMGEDNRRLGALLDAAESLATAPHRQAAAPGLSECARLLADARAAFLFSRDEKDGLGVIGRAGEGADGLLEAHREAIEGMAAEAFEQSRPGLRALGGSPPLALAAVPLGAGDGTSGALVAVRAGAEPLDPAALGSLQTLAGIGGVALRNSDLQDMQRNFFAHMIEILAGALDVHLGHHEGHGWHVAEVSNRLGRGLGLERERLERLHFAALLHDIGMLKIPREQHENRRALRAHASLGARMIGPIRQWEDLAPIIAHHHEWWNGNGYPDGLAEEAIPLESRILAVADAFDSMTNADSYKSPVPFEEAVSRLREAAGSQFDAKVVDAFVTLVERGDVQPRARR